MKIHHLVLPLIAVCLFGCTSAPQKSAAGEPLPPCGVLPNCVNSDSGAGGQAIAPLRASPSQWQQMKQWLALQPNWSITINDGDFLQAVVKTPVMRFRDDVQLQFDKAAGVIQVRSSSRLGISDAGTNRRRVEMLRHSLRPL